MILTSLTPFDRCTSVRHRSQSATRPWHNIRVDPGDRNGVLEATCWICWRRSRTGSLSMLRFVLRGPKSRQRDSLWQGGNKKPIDDRSLWILKLKMDTRNWQYMHVYSTHLSESFRWEPIFKFSAVQNALSVFMFLGLILLTIKQGNGNSISFICKSSRNGGGFYMSKFDYRFRCVSGYGFLNGAFAALLRSASAWKGGQHEQHGGSHLFSACKGGLNLRRKDFRIFGHEKWDFQWAWL